MRRFARELAITSATRVLDIGGTPEIWALFDVRPRITMLNMPRAGEEVGAAAAWVAADARALPFRDAAFDVVFSNSVIEHVGGWKDQQAFAREAARVARRCWIQTPNRRFPVETHLLTPLIHWLPRGWQRAIVPRFTVWAALTGARGERRDFFLRHYLNEIRLLDSRDMQQLFPGAHILRERFLGMTKSLIAVIR